LTITVSPDGSYSVLLPSPGWTFSGSIGAPASNLAIDSGSDAAGGLYNEITFDFVTDAPRHAAIRTYCASRSVLFTVNLPSGGPNSFSFPTLTSYPAGLHSIAFAGTFGFPTFTGSDPESPWVSFDAAYHTAILSPAAHFMVASTGASGGRLSSGISPQIAMLPAGFTQQTLLVVEDGIGHAFDTWGNLLTGVTGKVRPAKKADFENQGMALGYMQLDSWFYPKGADDNWTSMSGGIYEYQAATPPFTSSLATFQNSLGIPLVTHARWIDPASPYWQQFQMSGQVSTDPLYWAQVANYLAASGAVAFEQDWLFSHAATAYNLTDGDAFLDNMANSLAPLHIGVEYCSGTARHFLQSSKYDNLTAIRTSEDRFNPSRWRSFLYASRLASAVGAWPFTDVFLSSETGNLLLATLSAGPVGLGDRIGTLDRGNLYQAARRDGVIVKPDVPIAPIDSSFWNDSNQAQAPMVAATYSDFGGLRAWYMFAFAQGSNTQASFRLSDVGVAGPTYLYDYFKGTGSIVQPGDLLNLEATEYSYRIAAPVGPSGIALLGDAGQFVSLGKKRIAALSDDGAVSVTIAFAKGEWDRILLGYSPVPVSASATAGRTTQPIRDPSTGLFRVRVAPGPNGTATLRISLAPAAAGCAAATACLPSPSVMR
jgi:hypothetical protein